MVKWKKLALIGTLALNLGIATSPTVAAQVYSAYANPHPSIEDEWSYGVTAQQWAYSHYFIKGAGFGSYAAVTDIWGGIKDFKNANYGWAMAGATKQWFWVRAEARYGWYNF